MIYILGVKEPIWNRWVNVNSLQEVRKHYPGAVRLGELEFDWELDQIVSHKNKMYRIVAHDPVYRDHEGKRDAYPTYWGELVE